MSIRNAQERLLVVGGTANMMLAGSILPAECRWIKQFTSFWERHWFSLCAGHCLSPENKVDGGHYHVEKELVTQQNGKWISTMEESEWRVDKEEGIPSGETLVKLLEHSYWTNNALDWEREQHTKRQKDTHFYACYVGRTLPPLPVFWLFSFSWIQHVLFQHWVSLTTLPSACNNVPSPALVTD